MRSIIDHSRATWPEITTTRLNYRHRRCNSPKYLLIADWACLHEEKGINIITLIPYNIGYQQICVDQIELRQYRY